MILETIGGTDMADKTACGVSVVIFTKEKCPFCKTMKKVLGKLPEDAEIRIMEIDGVVHGAIAETYDVARLPTILFFKDGEVKGRLSGVANVAKLNEILNGIG
jgi:thiol-disulfide isomerase/thioredoxin